MVTSGKIKVFLFVWILYWYPATLFRMISHLYLLRCYLVCLRSQLCSVSYICAEKRGIHRKLLPDLFMNTEDSTFTLTDMVWLFFVRWSALVLPFPFALK